MDSGSHELLVWPATFMEPREVGDWRAFEGDLDQDGHPELIVVNLTGYSMGMGVEYYQAFIFDGTGRHGPPLRFELQEYGAHGSFSFSARDSRCRILASSWENGVDRHRGAGTYFVGQWFFYEDGELVPDRHRPVLARRFLNSFADQRSGAGEPDSRKSPLAWLIDPRAARLSRLPLDNPPSAPADTTRATMLATRPDGVLLATAAGDTLALTADSWPWDDSTSSTYLTLGDAKSGRPYPLAYVPGAGNHLRGRRVLVVTYRSTGFDPLYRIVWLMP